MITFKDLMEGRVGQKIVQKTVDSKLKQAVRNPGDVGKVERLQQMHQDKGGAKMTRVPDTAQRYEFAVRNPELARVGAEVLQQVSGVKNDERKKGSVRTPVDYNDPYQYRRKVKSLSKKMGLRGDEPEVDPSEAEFDPGGDPDAPKVKAVPKPPKPPRGWTMDSKKPEHKEYTKQLKDYQAFKDAGGEDVPKGRSKEEIEAGMERAQKSGQLAGRDATTAADQEFDSVIQQAASPEALPGVKLAGKDYGSSAHMRHAYQGSGVGQKGKTEMDDEYFNQMLGAIIDPDLATKKAGASGEIDPSDAALGIRQDLDQTEVPLIQRGGEGGYETKVMDPSARDVEAHSEKGEKQASDKAYLTPEVKKRQKALRDALNGQDSKAVQDLAFKFKDISDERLDSTIEMFGQARGQLGKEGKMKLLKQIEGRGGVDGERSVIWGGDDFADKVPDEAKKDADGNDLPPGIYDMSKITDGDLKRDIRSSRAREMVRTYLKQGGVDAYAEHEGFRSILDMDLEHIHSLKAGGYDSPDNWVWASSPLNQGRGDKDLGPYVDSSVDSRGVTGPNDGSKLGQTTAGRLMKPAEFKNYEPLKNVFDNNELLKSRFKNDFSSIDGGTSRGQFKFDAKKYDNLSSEEIKSYRENLVNNYGMSKSQAEKVFPDKGLQSGKTYGEDPKAYDEDATRNERVQTMYRDTLAKVTKDFADDPSKFERYGITKKSQLKKLVQAKIEDTLKKEDEPPAPPPTADDPFGGIMI